MIELRPNRCQGWSSCQLEEWHLKRIEWGLTRMMTCDEWALAQLLGANIWNKLSPYEKCGLGKRFQEIVGEEFPLLERVPGSRGPARYRLVRLEIDAED